MLNASCRADELVEFERPTVPTKPPRLVILIVAVLVEPTLTCNDEIEERLKSTTLTVIKSRWLTEPLVALTVTV